VDKLLERLKYEFPSEESRYAYADSVTNAFLTGQIKALREDRGLTQEQLAELVGTQQSGISRWQNSGYSSCKVETLRKFAKAFGVRLRITLEEFGSLPDDVRAFTKRRLAPLKFEDDTAFHACTAEERQLIDISDYERSGITADQQGGMPNPSSALAASGNNATTIVDPSHGPTTRKCAASELYSMPSRNNSSQWGR
jgi:transcriptional regulator with XRE-family HTH domain